MTVCLPTRRLTQPRWLRDPLWTRARMVPSIDLRMEDALLRDAVSGQRLVTFTRASPGTYIGSDGLIKTAATNLLVRSEEFDGAGWLRARCSTTTNVETAPDGLTTADKLVEDSTTGERYIQRNVAIGAGTYTHSIYVKAAENNIIVFRPIHAGEASNSSSIIFNLTTGPTATTNNLITGATMQVLPNGWRRCSVTLTLTPAVTSASFRVHLRDEESGLIDYTGDGTSGIYIWGAQLEVGSTATEYLPTGASINSAPRITHDPTTGRRLGLLVEEARTNLWAWSNSAVTGETWNNTLLASTAGEPDPAGGTSAILASDIDNATTGTFYQRLSVVGVAPLSAGTTVSYSIFIKPIDLPNSFVALVMYSNGTADYCSASFVTSGTTFTGAINPGQGGTGSVVSTKLETLSNGWYRLTLTGIVSTVTQSDLRTRLNIGNYTRVEGTPRFVWYGTQLEVGSFPTSYIPTTGGPETRLDDIATVTGTNFSSWYRQDGGSLLAIYTGVNSYEGGGTRRLVEIGVSGSSLNRMILGYNPSGSRLLVVTDGSVQANQELSLTQGSQVSAAGTYQLNSFINATNGTLSDGDTSGTVPSVSAMAIGNDFGSGAASALNGTISRLCYWPARLSNSTLQSLTR